MRWKSVFDGSANPEGLAVSKTKFNLSRPTKKYSIVIKQHPAQNSKRKAVSSLDFNKKRQVSYSELEV